MKSQNTIRACLERMAAWTRDHRVLMVFLLIPLLILGFLLEERLRGRISLARYLRALGARGEKMTARDFRLPMPQGDNGAPGILAANKELIEGAILPKSYPPRMRLTPAGRAIVCFREEWWVEDKSTNRWEQLSQDIQVNEATLDRIRIAMAKPVLDCGVDPSLGPKTLFPHLPVPRLLAFWFGSRIALGLHEGRTRETLQDLLAEIALPRFLERDGILISELVRNAIAAVARTDTWEALQADGWTDEDLAQLQRAWERQHFLAPMVRALEGERIFARGSFDQMRRSNKETVDALNGMKQFFAVDDSPWLKSLRDLPGGDKALDFLRNEVYCRLWRFAWLDQDEVHYLRFLERYIALGREASQDKSFAKLDPLVGDLILDHQRGGFYDRLRYPNVDSASAIARVFARAMRAETERSQVLAAIALKRYELSRRSLPQSLNELVPDFLSAVPLDYMDGSPLRFRRLPEGGFVLYSVGEDGKDDGGDASRDNTKTPSSDYWKRKDVVWPAPATATEIENYRVEAARK